MENLREGNQAQGNRSEWIVPSAVSINYSPGPPRASPELLQTLPKLSQELPETLLEWPRAARGCSWAGGRWERAGKTKSSLSPRRHTTFGHAADPPDGPKVTHQLLLGPVLSYAPGVRRKGVTQGHRGGRVRKQMPWTISGISRIPRILGIPLITWIL